MTIKKKKILFFGDSSKMNSGYSIVIKNLAIRLKRLGYDVSTVGFQTAYTIEYVDSGNDNDNGNADKIEVLPILTDKTDDVGQLMSHIQNIGPDAVIYVGNLGDNDSEVPNLTKLFPGTIVYVPVNGRDIPLGIVNDLNKIVSKGGKVIAMCKYGYEEMKRAGVNVDRYIYHGFDDNVFKKIDIGNIGNIGNISKINDKIGNKENSNDNNKEIVSILKWGSIDEGKTFRWVQYDIQVDNMPELFGYGKKFIYLHVGQNITTRKKQARLLIAYGSMIKESMQLRDHTLLHMHCLPISGRGANLIEVIMKLGIQNNVSFSFGRYLSAGWSPGALNVLYNLADVHVSASSSEGFGIPTIESMACGLPNIAPNATSFTELIGNEYGSNLDDVSNNRGLLAKIDTWDMEPIGRFHPLVSQEDLSIKMKRLYTEKKLREKLGDNAIQWVKQWSWDNIVDDWDKLLK